MLPSLINLHHVKDIRNWIKEPDNVYIGRCSKDLKQSIWANIYRINDGFTRETCIEKFTSYLITNEDLLNKLPSLLNKVLGCWCLPKSCHGEILIELLRETIIQIDC